MLASGPSKLSKKAETSFKINQVGSSKLNVFDVLSQDALRRDQRRKTVKTMAAETEKVANNAKRKQATSRLRSKD